MEKSHGAQGIPDRRIDATSTFIAIGVGQGDAFFMEKGDREMLVDGGRSLTSFSSQFERVTKRNHVNVLTCTHNDSDHGNGVLSFLQGGLTADEVWLPASWIDRLEDLILRPRNFFVELRKDIEDLKENRVIDLSDLGDQRATSIDNREGEVGEVKVEDLYLAFDQCYNVQSPFRVPVPHFYYLSPLLNKTAMLEEAVSAAELIREIAVAAYHSGSTIKWFDFIGDKNQFRPSGGLADFLVPVNAIEVAEIRRPKRSALEYIALTRSNKQSLVFMAPDKGDSPGALFTADSDLSFSQQIKWHDHMIITAPHHGSDANKAAYSRFSGETGGKLEVSWVRSDGRFMKRPGKSYLTINNRKYCTLCRNCRLPKQDIKLVLVNNFWQPLGTHACKCV
jgi:hypothetical protein